MDFLEESNSSKPTTTAKFSKVGLTAAGIIGSSAVILSTICLPFITPAFRKICLPYVPATSQQVENVFKALAGRKGTLIDLGSGDGRIVFEGAHQGFKAVGIELNPWLVLYSKFKTVTLSSTASFARKNIWKTPLTNYENVVIFGVESMMEELEKKCQNELTMSAVVVACRFPFPCATPERVIGKGIDKVWLYSNLNYNQTKCKS